MVSCVLVTACAFHCRRCSAAGGVKERAHVIHPVVADLANHASKALVKDAVLTSEMDYTLLDPTAFFQNFAGS
jgi:uncharacterized protein YbjT (DUF2867 family)